MMQKQTCHRYRL